MPKRIEYKITGPVPINGKQPGEIVMRDELEIPDILLAAGLISLVESPSASSSKTTHETPSEGDAA